MYKYVEEVVSVTELVWDDDISLPVPVTFDKLVKSWKWTDVPTFNSDGKAFNGNYKAVFVAFLFTLFLGCVILF